jgi:hypothetical protein
MVVREYKKKDGTITKHEYDQVQYNKKYNETHKEYYAEKLTCDCGLEYARNNKYYHKKTKAHQMYEKMVELMKTQNI